jgi:8-oxo-dGTP pyrophosphatase MutT (NUDIX family)
METDVEKFDLDQTVQTIVLDDYRQDEILMVYELGDPGGKPAGWALGPGGKTLMEHQIKVEKYLPGRSFIGDLKIVRDDTIRQIDFFLSQFGIDKADWETVKNHSGDYIGGNGNSDLEDGLIFLTAVREGLEEAGLLLDPQREVYCDIVTRNGKSHKVRVLNSEVQSGNICRDSPEIGDCMWFPLNKLPRNTYPSHVTRLQIAIPKLVDNRVVAYSDRIVPPRKKVA